MDPFSLDESQDVLGRVESDRFDLPYRYNIHRPKTGNISHHRHEAGGNHIGLGSSFISWNRDDNAVGKSSAA
jgi:hypothetical protein